MFDTDTFEQALETRWLAREIRYFDELESTNSYLKKLPDDEISHGMICLTDNQKRGRGQYERNWESEPGKNLTFTLVFCPPKAERLHVLTLACALAITLELREEYQLDAKIKWPNDIDLQGRKVGGLLTESVFAGNNLGRVLIGIGLNINQQSFSEDLDDKATSVALEIAERCSREQLLARILQRVEYQYRLWSQMDNKQLLNINRAIIGYNEWVGLIVNGVQREGRWKMCGINENGELTVINQEAEADTFTYEQIRLDTD